MAREGPTDDDRGEVEDGRELSGRTKKCRR